MRGDWPILLGPGASMPALRTSQPVSAVGTLAAAFEHLVAVNDKDAIVRFGVEYAREHIGLHRTAIFLVDERAGLMNGAWGTDRAGRTVDEHHVVCSLTEDVRAAFRSAKDEARPWTLVDNCPIVDHSKDPTVVLGRGWVACTPIASGLTPIGMMFNDAGLTGKAIEPERQTLAAILSAFLGSLLNRREHWPASVPRPRTARTPVVVAVIEALATDPSLSGGVLSKRYEMSLSRLARLFKSEVGLSLVEHRNRMRVDRFLSLVRSGRVDLLLAALDAGFGSYAQFHRVFRTLHGQSPREYLRTFDRSDAKKGTVVARK